MTAFYEQSDTEDTPFLERPVFSQGLEKVPETILPAYTKQADLLKEMLPADEQAAHDMIILYLLHEVVQEYRGVTAMVHTGGMTMVSPRFMPILAEEGIQYLLQQFFDPQNGIVARRYHMLIHADAQQTYHELYILGKIDHSAVYMRLAQTLRTKTQQPRTFDVFCASVYTEQLRAALVQGEITKVLKQYKSTNLLGESEVSGMSIDEIIQYLEDNYPHIAKQYKLYANKVKAIVAINGTELSDPACHAVVVQYLLGDLSGYISRIVSTQMTFMQLKPPRPSRDIAAYTVDPSVTSDYITSLKQLAALSRLGTCFIVNEGLILFPILIPPVSESLFLRFSFSYSGYAAFNLSRFYYVMAEKCMRENIYMSTERNDRILYALGINSLRSALMFDKLWRVVSER